MLVINNFTVLFRNSLSVISLTFFIWILFKKISSLNMKGITYILGGCIIYDIYAVLCHLYLIEQPIIADRMDFINTVIWVILFIYLIKRYCHIKLGQIVFIFFLCINYNDAIYLFYKVSDHVLPMFFSEQNLLLVSCITYIIINVICFPIMYLVVKKAVKPIIEHVNKLSIETYLWLTPVCIFLIYRFCLWPTVNVLQYSAHIVSSCSIPVIWFGTIMMAHMGMYITLQQAIVGVEAVEKYHALDRQNQLQQEQFHLIETQFNEVARLRHDSRHQILTVKEYLAMQEYDKADEYLMKILNVIQSESVHLCDNMVVEAIAHHFINEAKECNIKMNVSLKLPQTLAIHEQDLIAILGNLLENAFAACKQQQSLERFVDLKMAISGSNSIMISISNSFEGIITTKGEVFLSSKRINQEGIGISSTKQIVNKYNGIINITYDNQVFAVKILLNQ